MLTISLQVLNLQTCMRCAGGPKTPGEIVACPVDGQPVLGHAETGEGCGRRLLHGVDSAQASALVQVGGTWGPAMWKRLHTATDADEAWLMAWSQQLPCGPCKAGWAALLKEMPPVYGEGWFEWTWQAHQLVNLALSKHGITLEEARARWLANNPVE